VTVLVSMPSFGCAATLAEAVESVLGQTHRDLVLVVVNDGGDPDVAWGPIAHVDDPRLVRFDLEENRGRYWCDAVTLWATHGCSHWSPHDADDVSHTARLERTLEKMDDAQAAFGAFAWVRDGQETRVRYPNLTRVDDEGRLCHTASHVALYRTATAKFVGGPNPTFRVAYDTLFTRLVQLTSTCVVVDEPLYVYRERRGSLTKDRRTGIGSPARRKAHVALDVMHTTAMHTKSRDFERCFGPASWPDDVRAAVFEDVRRLSTLLNKDDVLCGAR